ncbi:class I SAM-dependent methyltransferase [Maritimibacter alkaliphilus]|uniref:class I SAM-dependent methyltransferase n=1 Tax=Maritimibacter alkaliphilus TaxID=404236 RepID=UPI001C9656F1|nr:methyltransferase domain-containing protein [Maritimibacter alkaliphilus]MBY6090050.1 class I SAM-dependent methyltransferase [Maritimibacter alkaliphilus]
MPNRDRKTYTDANRAAWEASAHLHGAGEEWEALLASASLPGFSTFDPCLTATLQQIGLSGKSAVQIGCNNARELLSLAAFGAEPALGIDQSAAFLAQGAQLAAAAGLAPLLLEADIYTLPEGDLGQHDLALITIGVLNWMPDLPGFFAAVAGLMAPGAHLVIYETHPFLELFDPASETPHTPAFNYFTSAPQKVTDAIAYDGQDHGTGETGYWFLHTMGAILTAMAGAGLRLETLTEHPHSNREPAYDLYEGRAAQIPMSYTLVARKG